ASCLDVQLSTALITWNGFKVSSSKAESFIIRFSEFLNMQMSFQSDSIQRTVPVLGNFDIGIALYTFTHFVGGDIVIIRTIKKEYHISILFNSTRFSEVTQLRNFFGIFPFFHLTT